jgi:hypothetical protein
MLKTTTTDAIRSAMTDYAFAARDNDPAARYGIDEYLQDRFYGQILIESTGRKIRITSVSNAGFNGMQISGRLVTKSGAVTTEHATTYVK